MSAHFFPAISSRAQTATSTGRNSASTATASGTPIQPRTASPAARPATARRAPPAAGRRAASAGPVRDRRHQEAGEHRRREAEQHLVPVPRDRAIAAAERQTGGERRDPERHRQHREDAGAEEERPEAVGEQHRPGAAQPARNAVAPRGLVGSRGCDHPRVSVSVRAGRPPPHPCGTAARLSGSSHDRDGPAPSPRRSATSTSPGSRTSPTAATERRLDPGEPLFEQGEPADHFYLVIEGRLKVTMLTPDGKQVLVRGDPSGRLLRPRPRARRGRDYPATCRALVAGPRPRLADALLGGAARQPPADRHRHHPVARPPHNRRPRPHRRARHRGGRAARRQCRPAPRATAGTPVEGGVRIDFRSPARTSPR